MIVTAIVLAAGESRRMPGEHKLLRTFRDHTIIEEVVQNIAAVPDNLVNDILVVTGSNSTAIRAKLHSLNVNFVRNPHYANGISSSIRAGLQSLQDNVDGFAICLGDMPLISTDTYKSIVSEFRQNSGQKIVFPSYKGQQGHPVLFPAKYASSLLTLDGDIGAGNLIRTSARQEKLAISAPIECIRDIDSPKDLSYLGNNRPKKRP